MNEHEPAPRDVGAGLPEDAPAGMGIDPTEHSENEAAGSAARDASTKKDGDPGQATGNPRAAGSDG